MPRLWTPPLRPLTPDTSVGFDQAEFARNVLRRPPDPWQEWAWVHAGELLPDGRPRFRVVLVLASRQNGKTETPAILAAYWLAVDDPGAIVGTSTKLEYATETWDKTRLIIGAASALDGDHLPGRKWYVRGAMLTEMRFLPQPGDDPLTQRRYRIAAANEEGGCSLTVRRLVMDELRQHKDYSAWNAAEPTTTAVWDAQVWCLSNAGDANSIVLNDLRDAALAFIDWWNRLGPEEATVLIRRGECPHDWRLGLFEWSAPEDADPTDIHALAMANPNLNRRIDGEALLLEARRAVAKGGDVLTGFKTEKMCIRVKLLNPAIDPGAWLRCLVPGDLSGVRGRLAACVDVAPDGGHVTLAVAGVLPDGRVRGELAAAWDSVAGARVELPSILGRIRPQVVGWFPDGPGAALAADLAERKGWPPRGVKLEPIRGDVAASCMGLEEQVRAGQFLHSGDPLLDAHIAEAERKARGDRWVFVRRGDGHVDAAYAMAGAVHIARTMPPPVGKPRLVIASDEA